MSWTSSTSRGSERRMNNLRLSQQRLSRLLCHLRSRPCNNPPLLRRSSKRTFSCPSRASTIWSLSYCLKGCMMIVRLSWRLYRFLRQHHQRCQHKPRVHLSHRHCQTRNREPMRGSLSSRLLRGEVCCPGSLPHRPRHHLLRTLPFLPHQIWCQRPCIDRYCRRRKAWIHSSDRCWLTNTKYSM